MLHAVESEPTEPALFHCIRTIGQVEINMQRCTSLKITVAELGRAAEEGGMLPRGEVTLLHRNSKMAHSLVQDYFW